MDERTNQREEQVMKDSKIIIEPELPIGTEFWIMSNNRPKMGLVSSYIVRVTSHTDREDSLYNQLWGRWLNGKHKEVWKHEYSYSVKLDADRNNYEVNKKDGKWWLLRERVYFSLDELKACIIN